MLLLIHIHHKGILYINGFNLGRYWPLVGPQITLYVPGNILKRGTNEIVLIELQSSSPKNNNFVRFITEPILDKQFPPSEPKYEIEKSRGCALPGKISAACYCFKKIINLI